MNCDGSPVAVHHLGYWQPLPTNSLRQEWKEQGWESAFDLVYDSLPQMSRVQARRTVPATAVQLEPKNAGAIIERYPPSGAAIEPLTTSALLKVLRALVDDCHEPCLEIRVAFIDRRKDVAQWLHVDGTLLSTIGIDQMHLALADAIPVAYGRAGFAVEFAVLLFTPVELTDQPSVDYLDSLWMSGYWMGLLEGEASDRAWTTRGNYAVRSSALDLFGFARDEWVPGGAVCIGTA